jgi:flagellar basal body-associated protein FliL
MGNLPFWLGLGAAQKSAEARGLKRNAHPIISLVVGVVVALVIVAGIFVLFAYQE